MGTNSNDTRCGTRYFPVMPATTVRPAIRFKGRNTAKRKAMVKAVNELVVLRKTNPTGYRELIGQYAGQPVRIVPG